MRFFGLFPLIIFMLANCQSANTSKESSALIKGRNMYHIRGCAACHGIKGDGKGDRSSRLNPPPRDFQDTNSYKQGYEITKIAETIKTGVRGTQAMPPYPYLSKEERLSIAKYVYFLQTNTNAVKTKITQ